MEFETYGDVIDAFERDNMGYDTLTDYIKGENIKIAEIDMDPIGDFAKIFNKKDGGMMIAIEQLGKGGITGGKTYHQPHRRSRTSQILNLVVQTDRGIDDKFCHL